MDEAKKTVDDQREKVGGMDEVHSFLEGASKTTESKVDVIKD